MGSFCISLVYGAEHYSRPPVVKPLDSFPSFCGTRKFITKFTRALHLSLSSARPIQSIPPHHISPRSILILSTHLHLGLPSGVSSWHSCTNCVWSSGESSWLQTQRSGFYSQCYQVFWEAVDLELGPRSLVSTIEELLGRNSSGSSSMYQTARGRIPNDTNLHTAYAVSCCNITHWRTCACVPDPPCCHQRRSIKRAHHSVPGVLPCSCGVWGAVGDPNWANEPGPSPRSARMVYHRGDTVPVLCPEPFGYSAVPPGMVPVSDNKTSMASISLPTVKFCMYFIFPMVPARARSS
jgi:hypothetical protein